MAFGPIITYKHYNFYPHILGAYIDTISREKLGEWHKDRIKRLMFNKPVNILAIETIPSYKEALAILDILPEFPGSRCWISFQCKNESSTAKNEPIEEAFKAVLEHPEALRVKAIGVNCVKPSQVSELLKKMNSVNHWRSWPDNDFFKKIPYVVYPNGGQDWDAKKKVWIGVRDDIIKHIKEWMMLGELMFCFTDKEQIFLLDRMA